MKEKQIREPLVSHQNQIRYYLNGTEQNDTIPAGQSTLNYLNKTKHLYGTKCSCNEGDCGACTVVVAYPKEGSIVYEAINSCLYPAAKLHGRHLITVEGLGTPERLHPIQQAMLDFHGTQCGYCTPGFVMSMFALFASVEHPDKETIFQALEGNLCRCTGYQSILEAAHYISGRYTPRDLVPDWCREIEQLLFNFSEPARMILSGGESNQQVQRYNTPEDTKSLFDLLQHEPDAVLIAGGTDLMVQMNIGRKEFPLLVDISRLNDLQRLYLQKDGLHIGACVSYTTLQNSGIVKTDYPTLHKLILQIASQQIRNFGTLGGNIANASPIGDSLPLLMALDATLLLQTRLEIRLLPIREFFLGYRKTALQKGEIIREIVLPPIPEVTYVNTLKSAKRKSVDISSVITAICLEQELGFVKSATLALGGVAPTPVLSEVFSKLMCRKPLDSLDSKAIGKAVAAEFKPISDVRGSAIYRSRLIANHIQIYLNDLQRGE